MQAAVSQRTLKASIYGNGKALRQASFKNRQQQKLGTGT
jgi:hypothetical protein